MANRTYIFVINDGERLILTPFDEPSIYNHSETLSLFGRYGTGDAPTDTEALRAHLNKAMEAGVKSHVLGKGFFLRLALAAITFLVVYLFLSIVVRDPVPIVDEFLIAGFASVALYFWSERRALASGGYTDSILTLHRALDVAFFRESRVMDLFEALVDEAKALGPASFYAMHASDRELSLSDEEREEAEALCSCLARRWRGRTAVVGLYDASRSGAPSGRMLDKAYKSLGPREGSLVLAYLKLLNAVGSESYA
ncbi:MAG: hypothetical protein E4H20_01405 [Spirochaetales bacterium]|nr:MAG: hypothetical protein E4H20_01405 [Spirochaetales bacterium]